MISHYLIINNNFSIQRRNRGPLSTLLAALDIFTSLSAIANNFGKGKFNFVTFMHSIGTKDHISLDSIVTLAIIISGPSNPSFRGDRPGSAYRFIWITSFVRI